MCLASLAGGDGWIFMRSQCNRRCLRFMPVLVDRAARRSIVVWSTSRSPRAPMPRGVCDGLRLPYVAALARWPLLDSNRMGAHTAMCAGGVLVRPSIFCFCCLHEPWRVSECLCVWRFVCLFGSPSTVSVVFRLVRSLGRSAAGALCFASVRRTFLVG